MPPQLETMYQALSEDAPLVVQKEMRGGGYCL